MIEEEGPKLAGHKNLISIEGIKPVGATVRLSAIGKIEDFADPGKLASYFGLVLSVQNSNGTERSGRITKQGNKLARTAPIQCSLVAQKYSPICRGSIKGSNVATAGVRRISPWRANSWESSITP